MTTVTGADGKTYDYDGNTLTITGTGAASSIVNGTVDSTYDFSGLKEVIIGEGITGLSDNAFGYCYGLTKATLPTTLTSLPRNGFLDTHLTEIRIPANVTSIGATFYRVYSLKKIIFDSDTAPTMVADAFGPAPSSDVGTVTVYSKGWANDTTVPDSVLPRTNRTVVFVTGVPATYKHILIDEFKAQVDSAIRDEEGVRFKTAYQKKLTFDSAPTASSTNPVTSGGVKTALDGKQPTLVSGTNIKTVNGTSLLGSGNISVGLTITTHEAV